MIKDVNKIKKIAVLTVAPDRISKEDANILQRVDKSLTSSFFRTMRPTRDVYSQRDVVRIGDNKNSVFAYFDNDAIFLVSENSILSPTELVNIMVNLQKSTSEMNELLKLVLPRMYRGMSREKNSEFGLGNLNINFVDLKLSTGMPLDVVEQYLSTEEKGKSSVSTKFDSQNGIISHSHTSQNGINVVDFLDSIITTNPDMGLLMSNVMCEKSSVILEHINDFLYGDASLDPNTSLAELLRQANKQTPLEPEEILHANYNHYITAHQENNERYREYPAFKAVVQRLGDVKDVNIQYVMNGDNEPADRATITTLNDMIGKEKAEYGSKVFPLRVAPEVEKYKILLDLRAAELSKKILRAEKTRDLGEN